MDKETFDTLFEEQVARRLARSGFTSKGKTLHLSDSHITVALIRLGGRMSVPGSISHILCFRHSFLRDRSEQVPKAAPTEVFDYPYKFKPLEGVQGELAYRPQNLSYDYERLVWDKVDESSVRQKLDRMADVVEDRFLPWAKALLPTTAKSEIEQRGEDAWCERMWIADYAANLPSE